MTKFIFIVAAYFLFEIIAKGLLPYLSSDTRFDTLLTMIY